MPLIPDIVFEALQLLETPAVFATVDSSSRPNAIYVMLVKSDDRRSVLISDGAMNKSRENIRHGSHGSVVFLTKELRAFQIKGTIKYHVSGPLFDYYPDGKDPNHPRHGLKELVVDEVYEGAEKLL